MSDMNSIEQLDRKVMDQALMWSVTGSRWASAVLKQGGLGPVARTNLLDQEFLALAIVSSVVAIRIHSIFTTDKPSTVFPDFTNSVLVTAQSMMP